MQNTNSTGTVLPLTEFQLCLRFCASLCHVNSTSSAIGTGRLVCRVPGETRIKNHTPHPRLSIYTTTFFHTKIFPVICFISQPSVGGTDFISRDFIHCIYYHDRCRKLGKRGSVTGSGTGLHHLLKACGPPSRFTFRDYFPEGKSAET
jgi:hypothetical protein